MGNALLGFVDIDDKFVSLVVHLFWHLACAASNVEDDRIAPRDILCDDISDSLVVLESVEAPHIPTVVKIAYGMVTLCSFPASNRLCRSA